MTLSLGSPNRGRVGVRVGERATMTTPCYHRGNTNVVVTFAF